jgi:hypothetical protein
MPMIGSGNHWKPQKSWDQQKNVFVFCWKAGTVGKWIGLRSNLEAMLGSGDRADEMQDFSDWEWGIPNGIIADGFPCPCASLLF